MKEEELTLGQLVAFQWKGTTHFGKVVSVERGVANIKGVEQSTYSHAEYHFLLAEIQPAYTHYSTTPPEEGAL